MPYLPKPKNNGKRTSLVPTWINKKNKSKSNQLQEESLLDDTIQEINNKKAENLNKHYSKYNNEVVNNSQGYEKVTYKNTTTRSVERVSPDGEYNKAVETNEQVEERIKFGSTLSTYDTPIDNFIDNKSNVIDLDPITEKEVIPLEVIEHTPRKLLNQDNNSSGYGNSLRLVRQDGMLLKNIQNQTKEICLEAVKQNGLALQYAKYQNELICLAAINENISAYKYITNKTPKLNLRAIQIDPNLIREIDENDQTEEIILAAVSKNGLLLKYIRNQTPRVCMEAINQNHLAFSYVKDKNEAICNEIVKVNGLALELIKTQTPEICKNAIRQNPFSLQFVINQTDELCEEALYRSGLALEYVKNKTQKLCLLALEQSSLAIRYIPASLLSESLDLSNYVFVCVDSRSLVPSIPEIRGLKRINLSSNDTGFNIMNTLKYNDVPTNFVVQKEGYIDDNFVEDLKSHNHFVVVVGPKRTL